MNIVKEPKNPNTEMSYTSRKSDIDREKAIEAKQQKIKKNSPFSRWYQVNKDHTDELLWLLEHNPTAYRILLFLCDHMDAYNAVMCSYAVLQEALDISRSTASRAISLLRDRGYIHVYRSGTSNVYVANPELVWNSWGNNRQYCEFPANIILSQSEQEERRPKTQNKKITSVQRKKNNKSNNQSK